MCGSASDKLTDPHTLVTYATALVGSHLQVRIYGTMETTRKSISGMELRKAAGLTQRDVCIALDVTEYTVRRWEKKKQIPHLPIHKVQLLTELYNCTLQDLVDAFTPIEDEPIETNKPKNQSDNRQVAIAS